MARKFEFKWSPAGYTEILNSEGVLSDLEERITAVEARAIELLGPDVGHGKQNNAPGFNHEVAPHNNGGRGKASARCWTTTPHAMAAQKKRDILQTALKAAKR